MVRVCLCALFVLAGAPAWACYWDKDTLKMEQRRLPGVDAMLAGRFVVHSPAFYRWRLADRRAALAADPSRLDARDDAAVALDKLGRHAEAIALAEETLRLAPRRYETLANLGTFHLHAGQYAAGLVHIRAALAVNPDAHFGREIVQARLVEYAIAAGKARPGLPLDRSWDETVAGVQRERPDFADKALYFEALVGKGFPRGELSGFAAFARAAGLSRDDALAGLLGMVRFGQPDHPVLFEALGDVLLWDWKTRTDAKRLAARAYLRAAEGAPSPDVAVAYRARAALALMGHKDLALASVEARFTRERARGRAFQAGIAADEARWIEAGVDVEARFDAKYLPAQKTGKKAAR